MRAKSGCGGGSWLCGALTVSVAICSMAAPAAAGEDGASHPPIYINFGSDPTNLYEVDVLDACVDWMHEYEGAGAVHALALCPTDESTLWAIGKDVPAVMAIDLTQSPPVESLVGTLPVEFGTAVVQFTCSDVGELFFTDQIIEALWEARSGDVSQLRPRVRGAGA